MNAEEIIDGEVLGVKRIGGIPVLENEDVCINHGGFHVLVTEQLLDSTNVVSRLQGVG